VSDPQAPAANYEAVVKELQAKLAATHAAIRALRDEWLKRADEAREASASLTTDPMSRMHYGAVAQITRMDATALARLLGEEKAHD